MISCSLEGPAEHFALMPTATRPLAARTTHVHPKPARAIGAVIVDIEAVKCLTAAVFPCRSAVAAAPGSSSIFPIIVVSRVCLPCLRLAAERIAAPTKVGRASGLQVNLMV